MSTSHCRNAGPRSAAESEIIANGIPIAQFLPPALKVGWRMADTHSKPHVSVRLATGGPIMDVISLSAEGRLWCEWEAGGYRYGGDFDRHDLVIVSADLERAPEKDEVATATIVDAEFDTCADYDQELIEFQENI